MQVIIYICIICLFMNINKNTKNGGLMMFFSAEICSFMIAYDFTSMFLVLINIYKYTS